MNRFALILAVSVLFSGCGTLNKTGIYSGDKFLYASELAINTGYDFIHSFLVWETNNRQSIKQWPEITKAADKMRRDTPMWLNSANSFHDAYKANPTDANKTALQLVLDEIRAAMTEASGYMLKAATTK